MVVKEKRSEDGTVVESVTNTCLCGQVIYTHTQTHAIQLLNQLPILVYVERLSTHTHAIQVRYTRRAATAGLGQ